jgi:hypothetical protein
MMEHGIFIHDPAVLEYAYALVNEYVEWQNEQDKLARQQRRAGKLQFDKGRWFSDDRIHHGMSGTPEYKAWQNLKTRKIDLDDHWQTFINFYKDVGDRPSAEHFLKRLDNDKPFGPDNCRWVLSGEVQTKCKSSAS